MRRFFGVLALCFGVLTLSLSVAIDAATPTASPSPPPAPKLVATPAPPTVNYVPSVVIYPFDQTNDLQADTGKTVAAIYAQAISSSPGINIAGIGMGVARPDYLTYARGKKADFYIAGYLTPVGNGAAIVEQIVDVETGIIVYSQTAQVFSAPETASLALGARAFMLARSGADDDNVGASDKSTPAPTSTNGAAVSLGGFGSLFHRGEKGNAPTPSPTLPPRPARGMYVLRVGGTAPAGDITSATLTMNAALAPYYTTKTPTMAVTNIPAQANAICGSNRDNTIATGTLSERTVGSSYRAHTSFTFTFDVYACFGAKLYESIQTNTDRSKAVVAAVKAYQADHPDNN